MHYPIERPRNLYHEAISAFEQLLPDQLRVLGPDAPDTLTTRHNLPPWLAEAGRVDEAITVFEQLLSDSTSARMC